MNGHQPTLWDAAEAREARDAGIERVSNGKAVWLEDVRAWALFRIDTRGQVTSDDVRRVWMLPEGASPSLYGAVWRDRRFRAIGSTHSVMKQRHANRIYIWGRA